MGKHKKYLVIMLALVMSVMTLMPACSGSTGTGIQQNVAVGKRVFVDKSGVVFFGYQNLICTALLKDGELSEFIPEGGTTGTIYAMAVYDDYLYISANDGFFRYPLSIFQGEGGGGSAEVVMTHHLESYDHFEIFEDKIFYLFGHTLYYVPVEGGEGTAIQENIYDFEVSDKGIYAVRTDGTMIVISPKLDDFKEAGSIAADTKMTVGGMNFYYRDGDSAMSYSVETQENSKIDTKYPLNKYCVPWSNAENMFYYDEDYILRFVSSGGETELGKSFDFPQKAEGCLYGDYLISIEGASKNMVLFDLAKGETKDYDVETAMKSYLDTIGGGSTGGDSNPEPPTGTDTTTSSSGGYDVMTNFYRNTSQDGEVQYLYFNDFLLTLPNADDITYEAKGDSVDIIFVPGKNAGYGGKLVTIRAYDINDDSYKSLPNYHVGGVGGNVNKRFIAIYPSDQQVSPEFESVVARYNELKDYLYKIGEGAVNSPLQTADSSPAP